MRPMKRFTVLAFALSLLFSLPVLAQKPPKTTNGTVAFKVASKEDVTTTDVRASLTVEKPGKTSLINGTPPAGANAVDGNHNFPAGTTSAGIGAYYRGLLLNAGWQEGTDFTIAGGVINFYGISKLDGGVNKGGVKCEGATDSKDVKFDQLDANDIKIVKLERGTNRMAGSITLTGFGLHMDEDQATVTSTTHTVTTHFTAADPAEMVLLKIRNALTAAGWQAVPGPGDTLEISRNGAGDPIASLHFSFEYYSNGDEAEENDDHWEFWVAAP